ncbi:11247_t:CDS:2 [Funneliformis geosporum]|uniref:11247_t:CDS:1 n=1 Tax=Funneliformis geosporum TaxID=1117311 RepID=A0A9W4SLI8_9GLOM|nr:11247_t:CDS:2 [Funneliformis geosporum]
MSEDATMDTAVAATIPATANLEPRNTKRITESSPTYTVIQRKIAKHLHLSPLLVAEITRTLFSMLAFVIVGFSCTFAIQSSDYRWKTSGDDMMALVDLGFKVIPYTEQLFLADLFMLTLLVGSLGISLFLAESNIARLIIVRRIFWMLTFLLGFRMITLSVTTLPSPKDCNPLEPGNFWDMFKTGVHLITGTVKACTDNIFSGHSIFITTSVILLRVYCRYKIIIYYSYLHGLAALSFLVATRIHYTVDVLLAVFITYSVHSIYFFIVDLCIEKHFLDIRKAEDRLGDAELYQRIAYMPNMFNTSLVGAVRWMDGLDIRFRCEGEEIRDITRERARQRRNNSSASSSSETNEMTQVVVTSPPQDDEGEPSKRPEIL